MSSYLMYEEEPGKYGGVTCTVMYNKNDDYATNPTILSYSDSAQFGNDPSMGGAPSGKFTELSGPTVDPDSPWKADTNPATKNTTYRTSKSDGKLQSCGAWKNIYTYGVKNEMYWEMKEAGAMDMYTGVRSYADANRNGPGVTVFSDPTSYTMADLADWDVKVWVDPNPDNGSGDGGAEGGDGAGEGGAETKPTTEAGTGDVGTCGGAAALLSAATAIAAMMAF